MQHCSLDVENHVTALTPIFDSGSGLFPHTFYPVQYEKTYFAQGHGRKGTTGKERVAHIVFRVYVLKPHSAMYNAGQQLSRAAGRWQGRCRLWRPRAAQGHLLLHPRACPTSRTLGYDAISHGDYRTRITTRTIPVHPLTFVVGDTPPRAIWGAGDEHGLAWFSPSCIIFCERRQIFIT